MYKNKIIKKLICKIKCIPINGRRVILFLDNISLDNSINTFIY